MASRTQPSRCPSTATAAAPITSNEHVVLSSNGLSTDAGYLGIDRSDDLVIIQITWNEGRTVGQKKALYKAITEGLGKAPGIRPEDVLSVVDR